MNIVVLAGGTSTERDVSIVTGMMICQALRRNGHKAILADVFFGYEKEYLNIQEAFGNEEDLEAQAADLKLKTKDVPEAVRQRERDKQSFFGPNVLELCKASDIVFIGLHGANGEDGKIQAAFDLMQIKYTGTGYLSSAVAMNKDLTKMILTANGIPMPKGLKAIKGQSHDKTQISFPCVVKPCCGGSSIGVFIVNNEDEYEKALKEVFLLEDTAIVEEYISGREFSVGILEGEALPVIEIEPLNGFYDYQNKYVAGLTKETCPALLDENTARRMQRYAEQAAEATGLQTYGRIDFIVSNNSDIYCLEVNTLPGMTGTSLIPQEAQAAGLTYDALCEKIIALSQNKYLKQ